MNLALRFITFFCILTFPLGLVPSLGAQSFVTSTNAPTNHSSWIDLPTALRLAGAQNLDIQIAVQRLAEAKANHQSAVWQFFPWLNPGVAYRRHDDLIQDVAGNILEVHKESYTVGPSVIAQVDLGEAVYRKLASRQLVKAANYALETQRQETMARRFSAAASVAEEEADQTPLVNLKITSLPWAGASARAVCLIRAGLDYLNAVAEHNKAQYALRKAIGALPEE